MTPDTATFDALFRRWLGALTDPDPAFFEATIADDWIYLDYTGHLHGKAEYIAFTSTLPAGSIQTELLELDSRPIAPGHELVHGRYTARGPLPSGRINEQDSRFMAIWRQQTDGSWQSATHQVTDISEGYF